MLFLIENKYVGPKKDDSYNDLDTIEISTTPALTNLTDEPRIQGWCGTTLGWDLNAHGQYFTLEEARAAIKDIFGEVRSTDTQGNPFVSDDDSVIEVYKPGCLTPAGISSSLPSSIPQPPEVFVVHTG